MLGEIFSNVLMQLVYFVGYVFLLGFLISLCNRWFYRLTGHGRAVCLATGLIGTPVHELSHALMAILFGHKIDEIKLFQVDDENGVLGYVRHSYNKRNLYQVTGNYFIGVAPILLGSLVVCLAMKLLLPYTFSEVADYFSVLSELQGSGFSWSWFSYFFGVIGGIGGVVFVEISSYQWGIFFILAACIALHMNLSGADIKSALGALPILAIVLIVVNLIMGYLTGSVYYTFLEHMNKFGGYLAGVLTFSLLLSVACVAIAAVVRGLISLIARRR